MILRQTSIYGYAPYVILKFDGMHDLIFCTYSYGGEGRYPMVVVNSTIDTRYVWLTYDITGYPKKDYHCFQFCSAAGS